MSLFIIIITQSNKIDFCSLVITNNIYNCLFIFFVFILFINNLHIQILLKISLFLQHILELIVNKLLLLFN